MASQVESEPKSGDESHETSSTLDDSRNTGSIAKAFFKRILLAGHVEARGIQPVPLEERTSRSYLSTFTIWCSINTNILAITFGILGPVNFKLSLRDSALVILCFNLLSTFAPAFLSTLGPKTGMRQMIQGRFSFGYYLVAVPVLLNLATLTGFCVVIGVIGGQCLSAVTDGSLSPTVGIVVITIVALLISFCGFSVLHFYEGYAWMPALVAIVIAVGCSGHQLTNQVVQEAPTAAQIFSYGGTIASYMIPWACIASDLTTYFDPKSPTASIQIFVYSYLGLIVPTVLLMTLGAAIGGAIANVPSWQAGFDETMVGGVLDAMLSPAHGFGKFVVVVLAFSLLANLSSTMYAITLNFQTLVPFRVPRYIFSVVVTAIIIPVAIKAADDFFLNLENFVGLIGCWSASFVGIVIVEYFIFRKANPQQYDIDKWDNPSALPSGVAALGSAVLSFGLVIPCMAQVWWTGPIGKTSGDIGFEIAFLLSAVLYIPLRYVERRALGR